MTFIIIIVALLIFMYFLLIRPQRQQQKRTQEMLARLQPGDEVITIGGLYGDVIEVHEDRVVLEIAEDVHIEVTRRAVANIVPPEEEDEELEAEDEELEAEADELEEEEALERADAQAEAEVEERTP